MLDHLSDGRAILGLGRGLGRVEFDGFRLEMGESRQRFTEYSEAILDGARDRRTSSTTASSTSSRASRSGRARSRTFKGRTFASAVSPQSMELMARLGVGIMVIAQKPWDTAEAELAGVPRALPSSSTGPSRPSRSWSWSRA